MLRPSAFIVRWERVAVNRLSHRRANVLALLGPADLLTAHGRLFAESSCGPNCWKHRSSRQGIVLSLRRQPAYDHSYHFISTFMVGHVAWHEERLRRDRR
jgi:S-formylglutathione hydrolase